MKALIFTMSCGEGHNAIAKSISQEFDKRNVENKIVQTFGFNKKREIRENKQYLWICKHIPKIYDYIWTRLRRQDKSTDKLPYYVKPCLKYFKKEIDEYQPDIIVCTHCYASAVISYMKKNNLINENIVTSTILFDITLAPYWEHSNKVDYIFQPLDNTMDDLQKKGYSKEQIVTLGFPSRNVFYEDYDKEAMRQSLGIENKFTVLTISGGNGLGNTKKLVKDIIDAKLDINLIVINGKNKKTYSQIEKLIKKEELTNVINLGFVNNIDQYMKASDVIISRGGGSSVFEEININKPIIFRENLIINEKISKQFFIENGCAFGMDKITDAKKYIKLLKEDKNLYNKMVENTNKFVYKYSAKNIVNFLIEKSNTKNNSVK